MGYRTHSKEIKLEAVKMALEQGVAKSKVARNLGISSSLLDNWIASYQKSPSAPFPGRGRLAPEQAELARLQKENERLKAELDFLKKAIAFFDSQNT
jgi:transposase